VDNKDDNNKVDIDLKELLNQNNWVLDVLKGDNLKL
jgi:hypothetical protein